jgi:hypothetical protein
MAVALTTGMQALVAAIDELLGEDPFALPDGPLLAGTEELITQTHRLDAVLARRLTAMESKESTVTECGRTVKGWLVEHQNLGPVDAGSRIALARDLNRFGVIGAALADGTISHEHARIIATTLRKMPTDLWEVAEKELVEASKFADPVSLGRACRQLREQLGLDDDRDARQQRLHGQRYLKLTPTFEGMTHIEGMLEPVAAAQLRAALHPLTRKTCAEDDRTLAQRTHDALADLAALALREGSLPDDGGEPAQIIVTTSLAELVGDLDRIHVPTSGIDGEPLPAGTIRMLACDAGIIPAVLGGASEILDLGRTTRTWSKAQRRAARLRDGNHCTWPGGCQTPIRYSQLHHIQHWCEHRGPTDLANGAHLCHFHHWLIHNRNWKLWRNTDGALQFRRT